MATSTLEAFADRPFRRFLLAAVRRVFGLVVLGAGLWLAVALFGFDPADPNINLVARGGTAVRNSAGAAGATAADLLLQTLGLAAWIVPIVLVARGLRTALDRPLAWPWLPPLALPIALLAAAAFLADRPVPEPAEWPFRVGLGGFVGDYLLNHLRLWLDGRLYPWLTGLVALLAGVAALGLRWGESREAFEKVAIASAAAGRTLRAAARETGRLSQRALRRAGAAAPGHDAEPVDREPALLGLFGRLRARLTGMLARV
ncbi:MAG: DNA translocase FtsK 4TM domain-containing protein, partial [Geminicoccaceae bacterium]|nr:DNA translocase FtsK 4TM domain-containing protein [Geminicoccaceae bacterium]